MDKHGIEVQDLSNNTTSCLRREVAGGVQIPAGQTSGNAFSATPFDSVRGGATPRSQQVYLKGQGGDVPERFSTLTSIYSASSLFIV